MTRKREEWQLDQEPKRLEELAHLVVSEALPTRATTNWAQAISTTVKRRAYVSHRYLFGVTSNQPVAIYDGPQPTGKGQRA